MKPHSGLATLALLVLLVRPAAAQLESGNSVGVAMGHLHLVVADMAANRDFWLSLGGYAVDTPAGEAVAMPGVMILLSEGEADSAPSVLDHVAFRVGSLAAIEARGFELELIEGFPGIVSIYSPAGNRIELFEDGTATNVWFEADRNDPVAERHNRPLDRPIDSHHLHYYLPEDQVVAARDWYVDYFGATPGMRWRYDAADLPGMNLNFSATTELRAATPGRSLDHIGFEVVGLEAFCRSLEAVGIEFDQPFTRVDASFATAVLTDPWGVRLELTEGLRSN